MLPTKAERLRLRPSPPTDRPAERGSLCVLSPPNRSGAPLRLSLSPEPSTPPAPHPLSSTTSFPSSPATAAIRAPVTAKTPDRTAFASRSAATPPNWITRWLTREFDGRRICTDVPEESLLLRKPRRLVPHEGGKVFSVGSRPYQMLLDWILRRNARPDQGRAGPQEAGGRPRLTALSSPATSCSWPSAPSSATARRAM